ncbi:Uncharacterized membrane protein YczE (YczE) [Fructobacillus fructosus]|uniref:DUF6198 family protein n=1 Tax=Fructobacillus fructosus TaxID=1631 RepID=UPI002D97FE88|nr:Uncharacterized membrane protein YczE (YczE) [Fructobacillus fructosus]
MKNGLLTRSIFFILGLLLVTLGNALTILSGEGNGIWTAASLSLATLTKLPLNWVIILVGLLVIVVNVLLLDHFSWYHLAGSVLFVFFFGEFIQLFVHQLAFLKDSFSSNFEKIFLVVFGIVIVCLGTSFYQRANLWMYPTDYLTDILALRFFSGSVFKGQLLAFVPALLIICSAFLATGHLIGIQIGTVLALLANGELIGFFHRYAFPVLKHN